VAIGGVKCWEESGATPKLVTKARKSESTKKEGGRKMSHEFEALSGQIIEAAIHVHKTLGPGFVEPIYHSAMKVALRNRGIVYETEKEITIVYEGEEVGAHRLDLIVAAEIVVELKAVKALADIHAAQLRSYLKATRIRVGLLLNFQAPTLEIKRVVM
jgi:GxxExxY protein